MDKIQRHKEICIGLNELYAKKNHDYGDSFHQTFLEEGLAMPRIRLSDKFSRFKSLSRGKSAQVNDESIKDTLLDLANYAIMTVLELECQEVEEDDLKSRNDIPNELPGQISLEEWANANHVQYVHARTSQ